MANPKPDHIEFAGDYKLDNVFLHNHMGEITDIKKVMVELNIYGISQDLDGLDQKKKICLSG